MDRIEVKAPVLPESVSQAKIITWYKQAGDSVRIDEKLLDVETDKIVLEVSAPIGGILSEILKPSGTLVKAEEILGYITKSAATAVVEPAIKQQKKKVISELKDPKPVISPAARRAASEQVSDLKATEYPEVVKPLSQEPQRRLERRETMSLLRARIAERLMQAQKNAVILTTFNEVNMQPIVDLRKKYNELFQKDHGVKLGFTSFFVMAAVEALKNFPMINASTEEQTIIYHDYYDISIAVASERGLVVPVIREADQLHIVDIERKISEFSKKAKNQQLTLEEMMGGTFTISNGGVFGLLLSTPILNPPQSAILGLHKMMERPIVQEGSIVIKPMMNLALSYDHRLIDGAEAVQFLVSIKNFIEDPTRLLLEI